MKKLMLACAALCLTSVGTLTACAPTTPPATSPDATTMDEKALLALETSYNVAGNAYLAAVDAGVLTGARKEEARLRLQTAYGALLSARRAYEIGNSSAFWNAAAVVRRSTQQARDLLPAQ